MSCGWRFLLRTKYGTKKLLARLRPDVRPKVDQELPDALATIRALLIELDAMAEESLGRRHIMCEEADKFKLLLD